MTTPSNQLADSLEVMAAILRHPSNDGSEHFRNIFQQFNQTRTFFPELLTDEELNHEMKSAHEEMQHMREHPFAETAGRDEILSDRITALDYEHQKRFG